jgi:peptidoglycan/LPS O-acetylase OafA/YrhL
MNRQYGLDLARFIAAYLVLFGHYIFGGTFGVDSVTRQWVGKEEHLPLLNKAEQSAWMIDFYLLGNWNTATAIIGVALFFLISGWIVPPMLHRYSRSQFLLNRIFRIFPMLIVAVLAATSIQYCFGDRSSLHLSAVLSTLTLTNQFTGSPTVLGVVWTLIVEFKFYLLLVLLGRLNYSKILWTIGIVFLFFFINLVLVKQGWYSFSAHSLSVINSMIHDFYYILFMLFGSSIRLCFDSRKSGVTPLNGIWICTVALLSFNTYRYGMNTVLALRPLQDINLITQAIVCLVFVVCLVTAHHFSQANIITRWLAPLSNVTYSIYLIHVSLGYFALSRLRHFIHNEYLLLALVILIVTLVSALSYRLVEVPANKFVKTIINNNHMR